MENEALTMRRLCADDLFTMMRILSKIGVNDLRSAMRPRPPSSGCARATRAPRLSA